MVDNYCTSVDAEKRAKLRASKILRLLLLLLLILYVFTVAADKLRVHWQSTRSSSARELRTETKSGSGKRKRAVQKFTRNLAFLHLKSTADNCTSGIEEVCLP